MTVALIAENPRLYPVTYRGVRRAITRRFPCKIFYQERGNLVLVLVLAVRHHGQRPLRQFE